MFDYAIGDVQGCYDSLQRLLEKIAFNEKSDRLWFVGDLVNRGPKSLGVLQFIQNLPIKPRIVLGNHDLHLLCHLLGNTPKNHIDDTLKDILKLPNKEEIGHWLRQQSILIHDSTFNVVLCHSGLPPFFTLDESKALARELENTLQGDNYYEFLHSMYGNEPSQWNNKLTGIDRLRYICNAFTRMRYCSAEGKLLFEYSGPIEKNTTQNCYPWFAVPGRIPIDADIVFGHWAALEGRCSVPRMHAIDTGCYWGGSLTALRLQDMQRFAVRGQD